MPLSNSTKEKIRKLLASVPEKDRAKVIQLAAVNRKLRELKKPK
jgi:hypothetical protein